MNSVLSDLAWPREKEARELLAQLVAIPSVNPLYDPDSSEERLASFLVDYMAQLDIPAELD